jgi:HK97 family phage portal protein
MGFFNIKWPRLTLGDAKREPTPRGFSIMGGRSKSAATITPRTAMQLGGVWRAVNLMSGIVGMLPCKLFEEDANGGKTPIKTDPRYKLIRRRVSPEISAASFRETLTAHALLRGNGYAFILRDPTMRPLAMWPLDPDKTFAARDDNKRLWYVTQIDGRMATVPDYEVLHIRGLGDNGITGFSVVSYFAEEGGLATSARDFASLYYANGANVGGIVQMPQALSETAYKRLRDSLADRNEGPENAHKTLILEEGGAFNRAGIPAKDAQLLDSRKFSLVEIGNWFGVPPHVLGDSSRTAYNSLAAENQAFLDYGLNPWLVRWEDEYRAKLLTEVEQDGETLTIDFDGVNGLLVEPRDAPGLAAAVNRLLADPAAARRLAQRALDDCRARWMPNHHAARKLEAIGSLWIQARKGTASGIR